MERFNEVKWHEKFLQLSDEMYNEYKFNLGMIPASYREFKALADRDYYELSDMLQVMKSLRRFYELNIKVFQSMIDDFDESFKRLSYYESQLQSDIDDEIRENMKKGVVYSAGTFPAIPKDAFWTIDGGYAVS